LYSNPSPVKFRPLPQTLPQREDAVKAQTLKTGTCILLTGLLAISCSDSTAPEHTVSSANIKFLAGFDVQDTAQAKPIQAMVVEIHDDQGALLSGTVVRFEAVLDSNPYIHPSMYVGALSSSYLGGIAFDSTNSRGRASIAIQLGIKAGTGRILVTVPDLGVQDTAYFTILPGQAASVAMDPPDTALYVGAKAQLRGAVVDRNGNPRTDPVTFQHISGPVTISSTGAVTAGATYGRGLVAVSAMGLTDSTWISVVPAGTLAAYRFTDSTGIVTFNLDGSGYKHLTAAAGGYTEVTPVWSSDGAEISYGNSASGGPTHLKAVTLQGVVRDLLQPLPASLVEESWPHYSHDGTYVYFSGHENTAGNYSLWRVARNGTGAVRVGSDVGCCNIQWRPSPSADGTRLAFITIGNNTAEIHVLTLASGAISSWGVTGQSPRWSPTAERIAFSTIYGGPLKLMNSDGSNVQTLTPAGRVYAEGAFDWSPDGRWLVARGPSALELIDTQTGLTLPLGYSGRYTQPSWKP